MSVLYAITDAKVVLSFEMHNTLIKKHAFTSFGCMSAGIVETAVGCKDIELPVD